MQLPYSTRVLAWVQGEAESIQSLTTLWGTVHIVREQQWLLRSGHTANAAKYKSNYVSGVRARKMSNTTQKYCNGYTVSWSLYFAHITWAVSFLPLNRSFWDTLYPWDTVVASLAASAWNQHIHIYIHLNWDAFWYLSQFHIFHFLLLWIHTDFILQCIKLIKFLVRWQSKGWQYYNQQNDFFWKHFLGLFWAPWDHSTTTYRLKFMQHYARRTSILKKSHPKD